MNKKLILLLANFCSLAQAASISDTIDTPGIYKYRATVIADPTDSNDAVITIATSDVVFDLDGYLLTQNPLNGTPGLTGVLIKEGLSNIAIRNGRIDNVTGYGIKISDGCHKIKIDNMVISNCDQGGILLDGIASGTGVDSFLMHDSVVVSCTGANGSPAFGIKVDHASAIGIYDSFFNDSDAMTTSSGYGVWLESCSCAQFIRCVTTNNGGNDLGLGFAAINSINLCFQDCLALHNIAHGSATDSLGAGFYFDNCSKSVCLSCKCIETLNEKGQAVGFFAQSGIADLFEDCIAEANSGGSLAAGFYFAGEDSSAVIKSRSMSNEATAGSSIGYGIYLQGNQNNKCYIRENEIVGNTGVSSSYGIKEERNPSVSNITRNSAFNNGTNFAIDYPNGIILPVLDGSLSNSLVGLPSHTPGELDNIDIDP
jgi:Right handed beta helix region